MAAKAAQPSPEPTPDPTDPVYTVAVSFNRVDPDTRRDTRHEAGEPYPSDGPDVGVYLERGLIALPGAADSASESDSSEDQEN